MPHIYAGTEKDLYFAVGYLMGRERLWQMDLIRRATRGRLSEIFGADYVETDLFLRSLCMTEKSKLLLANAPEIILRPLSTSAMALIAL
jgi:penicillin G amidase